jgi:hypothetical protein
MSFHLNYFALSGSIFGKPVNIVTDTVTMPTGEEISAYKAVLTNAVATEADAKKAMVQEKMESLKFKMEPGQVMSVTGQDIIDFVTKLTTDATNTTGQNVTFPAILPETMATETLEVRDFSFSVKPKEFEVKVILTDFSLADFGVPTEVVTLIDVNRVGVGLKYSPDNG